MTSPPGTLRYADRYRVVRRIGAGGMATVFLAEDERLGRQVAIKRLHADSPEDMARRFDREARLGASLNHPNLVTVFDTVVDPEGVLIVMEYVEGGSLGGALKGGALPQARALAVIREIAAGLDSAHAKGIVHRDVKPANILLAEHGQAKLADLGIAFAAEQATHITRTGTVLGTPSYMAPEQLEGREVGPGTDIYALAAVAFEALSGRKARTGGSPLEIAHRIATQPAPALREAWAEAPEGASEVLCQGMAFDPADRPPSAGELAERLSNELGERGRPSTAASRRVRRGEGASAAAGGAAAGALAAGAAGAASDGTAESPAAAEPAEEQPPEANEVEETADQAPAETPPEAAPAPEPVSAADAPAMDAIADQPVSSEPAADEPAADEVPAGEAPVDEQPVEAAPPEPGADVGALAGAGASGESASEPAPVGPARGDHGAAPLAAGAGLAAYEGRDPEPSSSRDPEPSSPRDPEPQRSPAQAPARSRRSAPSWLVPVALLLLVAAAAIIGVLSFGGGADQAQQGDPQVPAENGGSDGSQGAAAAPASDPAKTVTSFYELAAAGDYQGAWALAGPGFRSQVGGFESFRGGVDTLESIKFEQAEASTAEGDSAEVQVRTVATHSDGVDRCSGSLELVRGGATGWLIDRANISCPDSTRGGAGASASPSNDAAASAEGSPGASASSASSDGRTQAEAAKPKGEASSGGAAKPEGAGVKAKGKGESAGT